MCFILAVRTIIEFCFGTQLQSVSKQWGYNHSQFNDRVALFDWCQRLDYKA